MIKRWNDTGPTLLRSTSAYLHRPESSTTASCGSLNPQRTLSQRLTRLPRAQALHDQSPPYRSHNQRVTVAPQQYCILNYCAPYSNVCHGLKRMRKQPCLVVFSTLRGRVVPHDLWRKDGNHFSTYEERHKLRVTVYCYRRQPSG
jgi:hypothetical protein